MYILLVRIKLHVHGWLENTGHKSRLAADLTGHWVLTGEMRLRERGAGKLAGSTPAPGADCSGTILGTVGVQ